MKITQILYKLVLDCKQGIQDSFYCWRQDRLDEKYRKLSAQWNQVSRQCYALEQSLRLYSGQVYFAVLKKYNEAYAQAQKLRDEMQRLGQKCIR